MSNMAIPIILTRNGGHSPDTCEVADDSRSRARTPWTIAEVNRFKAAWAEGGLQAAIEACPGRSPASIYAKARQHGFAFGRKPTHFRPAYTWTAHHDDLIRRRAKEKGITPGLWRDLAIELNRPRRAINYRAVKLGLGSAATRPANWSPEEDAILRASMGLGTRGMVKRLRAAGYMRSETAVRVRVHRLGGTIARNLPKGMLTPKGLAGLLGVDQRAVTRWIAEGHLPAKSWDKDNYLIRSQDVRKFALDHPAHIHLGKIEAVGSRYWFIDLLAGADR